MHGKGGLGTIYIAKCIRFIIPLYFRLYMYIGVTCNEIFDAIIILENAGMWELLKKQK